MSKMHHLGVGGSFYVAILEMEEKLGPGAFLRCVKRAERTIWICLAQCLDHLDAVVGRKHIISTTVVQIVITWL